MENQKELEGLRKSKGALEQLIAHHLKGQKAKKRGRSKFCVSKFD